MIVLEGNKMEMKSLYPHTNQNPYKIKREILFNSCAHVEE